MSSAANDKRDKLEEEFQSRMYDAEASPSQHLWARIDHDLTVQENGAYKKRAAFYRQLAAACITLLLLAGGVGAWYFSSPAATEQTLATVAPASNPDPATALRTPSEEGGMAGAVTPKPSEQDENVVTAPGTTNMAPVDRVPVAPATMAAAPNSTSPGKKGAATTGTALPQPDAESSSVTEAATGALAVAGTEIPEALEEEPLSVSRSLKQRIAILSGTEQKTGSNMALLQQSFAATETEVKANGDFRKLNEQVMAQAKRIEEEQKANLLAFNEEAASKKGSKEEKGEGNSRWSLGMAYAPGYFEQNIGLPAQNTTGAGSRQSLMFDNNSASSISSLYLDEARDEYTENADPGFSFGFEVKTGLKIGKKLRALTGLGFLQNTSRSKSSYMVQPFWGTTFEAGSASDGPSTIFVPSISSDLAENSMFVAKTPEYEVEHRYRYLTVPVELQYQDNMGKDWFWYGGAGVAANILMQMTILSSSAEVKDVEYDLQEESPFRRMQWSGRVSGGVGKRLPGNMSVTIGPEFRSYFSSLLAEPENVPVSQGRPYALGLNMAVNYDLSGGKKSR